MFRQICNSCEPKIIGVRNGIFQVEILDKDLESREDYKLLERLFFVPDIQDLKKYNEEVLSLKLPGFHSHLVKNAKLTDIMGFCPFFFGCKYIVSESFVDCLLDLRVDNSEYKLFPVSLENHGKNFYVLFVPLIEDTEIIFFQSLIYPILESLNEERSYFEVSSYEDFQNLWKKTISYQFEEVALSSKYENRDLLNIQGIGDMYVSERLLDSLIAKKISSLKVLKMNIKLNLIEP